MFSLTIRLTEFRNTIVLVLVLAAQSFGYAQPIDNTISYQGRLDIGGLPANGLFDFEAVVFDALTLGNQVSPILTMNDTDVTEGLINLKLDFGEGVFNGEQRFLELRVRDLDQGGALVILEPRQSVFATPYAISASKVEGNIIQSGTIGDCLSNGSTGGAGGLVEFERAFGEPPKVFLMVDESVNIDGCSYAILRNRTANSFIWNSFNPNGPPFSAPCDCIHWLAIGKP